jgi:hypothetical protein
VEKVFKLAYEFHNAPFHLDKRQVAKLYRGSLSSASEVTLALFKESETRLRMV